MKIKTTKKNVKKNVKNRNVKKKAWVNPYYDEINPYSMMNSNIGENC